MEFDKIIEELNAEKKAFTEKVKNVFTNSVKELFVEVPKLKGIAFTAYVPYFNDGEACVFSINEVNFVTEIPPEGGYDEDVYYGEGEGVYTDWNIKEGFNADEAKMLTGFANFLHRNEDILQGVLGSHSKVTITKNGITIEEYDHE